MKPIPLTTFRVSCENKSLYYKVVVWKTLKDFRRANPHNPRTLGLCRSYRTLGLCRSYRVLRVVAKGSRKRDRYKPILGEIHFAVKYLTTGIVAHEAAHAMIGWASEVGCIPLFENAQEREAATKSRNGFLTLDDPEERCCFVLGNMVRQIVFQLYKRGILK